MKPLLTLASFKVNFNIDFNLKKDFVYCIKLFNTPYIYQRYAENTKSGKINHF